MVKDFSVKQFLPEADIEALEVSISPRRSRRDVDGLCTNRADPVSDSLKNELRTIVEADKSGMP